MMNPFQMMQMIKNGKNPQQMLINMIKQQSNNNPVIKNAVEMLENGDTDGLEQLARNLCKEKHINYEEAINKTKNQFGIK